MNKICSRCRLEKLLSHYKKDKRGLYGVRSICKDCDRKYHEDYYLNNRDIILNNNLNYKKTDKGKEINKIQADKIRYFKKNTSDGSINYYSIQKLLSKQGNKCNYCKTDIEYRNNRHLDHIIPLTKNGLHIIDNVQWLCCTCNIKKGNKLNFKI